MIESGFSNIVSGAVFETPDDPVIVNTGHTMPVALRLFSATIDPFRENSIVYIGGYNGSSYIRDARSYNINSGNFTFQGSTANRVGRHAMGSSSSIVSIIGGPNIADNNSSIVHWDDVSWSYITSYPQNVTSPAFTSIGNLLYIAGGYNGSGGGIAYTNLRVWNMDTNTLTPLSPLLIGRSSAVCTHVGGKIYLLGGEDRSTYYDSSEIYDIASDAWSIGPDMPEVTRHAAIASDSQYIYVVGGTDLDIIQRLDTVTMVWDTFELGLEISQTAYCQIGSELYLFGGLVNGSLSNAVYKVTF